MRPLLQHASRSIRSNAAFLTSIHRTSASIHTIAQTASTSPSLCLQCQFRASSIPAGVNRKRTVSTFPFKPLQRRSYSSERKEPEKPIEPSIPPPESQPEPQFSEPPPPNPTKNEDPIERVPDEDLPSHREGKRWDMSKRLSKLMDELLPKLAEVTQKVNTYTGTDYSGIKALRREIKEHEKLVKARRVAVEEAKQALDAAHVQQASSSKEVVGLLERKHSWSATDLERYMSLIRSEHVNDQAVHAAKDNVLAAETALEEARSQLEKRERAQYHEEQIWSDTIRRNSTWVTFGLMGVNIFLLLASLLVFEPWRRRRMVREIRSALDEQKMALETQPVLPTSPAQLALPPQTEEVSPPSPIEESQPIPTPEAEPAPTKEEVSEESPATEPTVTDETLADMAISEQAQALISSTDEGATVTIEPEDISQTLTEGSESLLTDEEEPQPSDTSTSTSPTVPETPPTTTERLTAWKTKLSTEIQDLFSERSISVRKIDFTAAFLQGAAAGAVICGSVFMLLRRN